MLKWIDGFEQFGITDGNTAVGPTGVYNVSDDNTSLTRVRTGRLQGSALSVEGLHSASFGTRNLGDMATVIVGFGFRTSALSSRRIVTLREDDNATEGINVRLVNTGALAIYLTNSLIATTGSTPIAINTWYYIELKVSVANSGTYEVRLNGANVLSGSADTRAGASNDYANRVVLVGGIGDTTAATAFDDFYVCDATGAVNNDFKGDVKVLTVFPNAEGDDDDFTPSSGTDNSLMVDDATSDTNSTYVESSTTGHKDLYQHGDITASTVYGVQQNALCRKTDATDFDLDFVAKSGTTEDTAASQTVSNTDFTDTFAMKHRILEEDPDTTDPWDQTGFNAAQFGYQVG